MCLVRSVERTHNVDLVILPGLVALVDVDDVVSVVDAEDGVGSVPVDVVALSGGQHKCLVQHPEKMTEYKQHDPVCFPI